MHIWTITRWEKYYSSNIRAGLRIVIDKDVDTEVRRACKEFAVWLRKEYYFPVRVPVYIKSSKTIKSLNGEYCVGTFFRPDSRLDEPYIRLAAGDYIDLYNERGKDNALAAILSSFAHELHHYFQWINNLEFSEEQQEIQADKYSMYILDEYSDTREHP